MGVLKKFVFMHSDNPYENLIGKPVSEVEKEEMADSLTSFFQVLMEIDQDNKKKNEK